LPDYSMVMRDCGSNPQALSASSISRSPRCARSIKTRALPGEVDSGSPSDNAILALQLLFLKVSESMGNHDSKVVDAGCVD
jgi:hypothetical protein